MTALTETIEALERARDWLASHDSQAPDAARLDALAKALREGQMAWRWNDSREIFNGFGEGDDFKHAHRVLILPWSKP